MVRWLRFTFVVLRGQITNINRFKPAPYDTTVNVQWFKLYFAVRALLRAHVTAGVLEEVIHRLSSLA